MSIEWGSEDSDLQSEELTALFQSIGHFLEGLQSAGTIVDQSVQSFPEQTAKRLGSLGFTILTVGGVSIADLKAKYNCQLYVYTNLIYTMPQVLNIVAPRTEVALLTDPEHFFMPGTDSMDFELQRKEIIAWGLRTLKNEPDIRPNVKVTIANPVHEVQIATILRDREVFGYNPRYRSNAVRCQFNPQPIPGHSFEVANYFGENGYLIFGNNLSAIYRPGLYASARVYPAQNSLIGKSL